MEDNLFQGAWDELKAIFGFLKWMYDYFINKSDNTTILTGKNSVRLQQKIIAISETISKAPFSEWGNVTKTWLNSLSKDEFYKFQARSLFSTYKTTKMASRGYIKLGDLIRQSKIEIRGRVLSLCAGRGGWDQKVCEFPEVENVTSVTLGSGPGHEGHENYTDYQFKNRHKVNLTYGNIKDLPVIDSINWILFDGGESDPNYTKESTRFIQLLDYALPHIKSNTGFVIKILTPTHPDVISRLKKIQESTGKGAYYRCSVSKPSTQELYFISTKPRNLQHDSKQLLKEIFDIASEDVTPKLITQELDFFREEIACLPPLDLSIPIYNLGERVLNATSVFRQWESLGVYQGGMDGSTGQSWVDLPSTILGSLKHEIPNFLKYKLTDTTPSGFRKVFSKKVDTTPKEYHQHTQLIDECMEQLRLRFISNGFNYNILEREELLVALNKQGAPGPTDFGYKNIGEYVSLPDWEKHLQEREAALYEGKPIGGVWKTMGKREKKKMEHGISGSRMVAYMDIPERIIETKYFNCLMELTKPKMNPGGVGGLGLHDFGMRLNEIWKGYGINDDVAGFDTRVSATDLNRERNFIVRCIEDSDHTPEYKKRAIIMVTRLYQLYTHPHILIPVAHPVHTRCELLRGRGQRMSGAGITYSMNTLTQQSHILAKICVALELTPKQVVDMLYSKTISMAVSGDDSVVSMDYNCIKKFSDLCSFDNETGKIRKDISLNTPSPIRFKLEEVEFCSHYYEKISFFDQQTSRKVYRWMPTRSYGEILAKATIWLGATKEKADNLAWSRAMGYNMLSMYPHMRIARKFGAALLSTTPENIILTEEGGSFRPRPWMRPEEILEVVNIILFGESTAYPVPDFRVHTFSHVGYLPKPREKVYGYDMTNKNITKWSNGLPRTVALLAYENGGNPTALEIIGRYAQPTF